ncbi:MAG: hypothetical protein M3Y33_10510, partial [Actinomycetota bacterium]|nr:hypothetical protein [Actinomycetota bacterium]
MAPRHGDGEAGRVIGAAFGGRLPDGVRVTTKRRVGRPPAGRWPASWSVRYEASLDRTGLSRPDLFFVHDSLVEGGERKAPRGLFAEAFRPGARAAGLAAAGSGDVDSDSARLGVGVGQL